VQSLVYSFIVVAALAIGAAAHFGLAFPPADAIVLAVAFLALALVVHERTLRERAEHRWQQATGDLSIQVANQAAAMKTMAQQVDAMALADPAKRLATIEADVSVLGTVLRQVAETVAGMERAARKRDVVGEPAKADSAAPAPATTGAIGPKPAPKAATPDTPVPPRPAPAQPGGPLISADLLRQAIDDGRLVQHLNPIIALPSRKARGYNIVPRLRLDADELADQADFMPRQGADDLVRLIERRGLDEALNIARRALFAGQPTTLYVSLSRPTLKHAASVAQILDLLETNKVIAENIVFKLTEADWSALEAEERAAMAAFVGKGVAVALTKLRSLRLNFAGLSAAGVNEVRIDARRFLEASQSLSDFHAADVPAYLQRFGVALAATGVTDEQQLLMLLEDGVPLAQGPHVGKAGPPRADLTVPRPSAQKTEQPATA
jgi:cyclic-di-GMP phosphodiesterase, flagellum assembly factor TipF